MHLKEPENHLTAPYCLNMKDILSIKLIFACLLYKTSLKGAHLGTLFLVISDKEFSGDFRCSQVRTCCAPQLEADRSKGNILSGPSAPC